MGKIITLADAQKAPPGQVKNWLYCGLDVTGTREIADTLLPRLSPGQNKLYALERAFQGPALGMMLRGVKINTHKRTTMVLALKRELDKQLKSIGKMKGVVDVWDGLEKETGWCPAEMGKRHKWPRGEPDTPKRKCERCGTSRFKKVAFQPGSSKQVDRLFYELHKITPFYNKKGLKSTDGDILERIGNKYPKLQHITEAILDVRDKKKQLGSLNAKLTDDVRYPSSFNVGAAWTGRFSSSKNPYGLGGNLQNWAERHRACAIADWGKTLAYVDLKQAESNVVAHLAQDEEYINAHRSGDVHTYVTRLVWPDLPWTGDLAKDKKIAKQNPDWDQAPGHDFRFQAKRIQHGSNYGLTPAGIAMIARIPKLQAEKAQSNYFSAFPGIPNWQHGIRKKVRAHEKLVNPIGREVLLFGRPWDEHTYKQALSFIPQSTVADVLDIAMYRIWEQLDPDPIELLAQIHDALLMQFPSGKMEGLKLATELMRIPIPIEGRILIIEPEIAVGQNWGKQSKDNPQGMQEIEL